VRPTPSLFPLPSLVPVGSACVPPSPPLLSLKARLIINVAQTGCCPSPFPFPCVVLHETVGRIITLFSPSLPSKMNLPFPSKGLDDAIPPPHFVPDGCSFVLTKKSRTSVYPFSPYEDEDGHEKGCFLSRENLQQYPVFSPFSDQTERGGPPPPQRHDDEFLT